jgi:hypothetical protein
MSSIKETITELAHSLHEAGLINDKTLLEFVHEKDEEQTKKEPDDLDLPTAQKSGYIKAN